MIDRNSEQVELPICWRCERPIQLGAEVIVGIGRVAHATCHLPPCPSGLWWSGWGYWDEPTCTVCGEEYGDHERRKEMS